MNYQEYKEHLSKIADINHAIAVLSWDKEVYLPKGGAKHRSQQVATLSAISHELSISPILGESLEKLATDDTLSEDQRKNILSSKKDYAKATKFDKEFVINRSKAISESFHAWIEARSENKWSIFAKKLKPLLELKKEESHRFAIGDHPYDALLDLYEPGMRVKSLDVIFEDVKQKLYPLIDKISKAPQIDDSFLYDHYPKDAQWKYGMDILKVMGYDFDRGRQDISTHPFTTSFSSNDVRITTRIDEHDFKNMLWSTIHEGGHALYEQGLKENEYGLPNGSYVSLGIHESQSRLWENNVGRSEIFWNAHYKGLVNRFDSLSNISSTQFFKAINKVAPNLIRTEADELHYHLHVMIRYEIEKSLLSGTLNVDDLRDVWNESYKKYMGSYPENDLEGVLQDIHWSHGSFGYFPTYSLGSFYAAQLFDAACEQDPIIKEELSSGKCIRLLDWLRKNIHQYGRKYTAEELCIKATGRALDLDAFMNYAENKYAKVYNV